MAIKTVRFNQAEEKILKKVLTYYNQDFSGCVKALLAEKIEDLRDLAVIRGIREGKREDYLSGGEIDKLFKA